MKRKKVLFLRGIGLFLSVLFIITPFSFAGLIPVEDINLTFAAIWFYQGDSGSYFHVDHAMTTVGDLRVKGASSAEYVISANVTVSNCDFVQNIGSGNWAAGEFEGGATLTVTGSLWHENDPSTLLVNNGTILQAEMVKTSAEVWELREITNPGDFNAGVDFGLTGGGLNTGIDVGNGDLLVLGPFSAVFSFYDVLPTDPSEFGTVNILGFDPTLQITVIPEPGTMVLLVAGLGFIWRKKTAG